MTFTTLSPMYMVRGMPAGHSKVAFGQGFVSVQLAVVHGQKSTAALIARTCFGLMSCQLELTMGR